MGTDIHIAAEVFKNDRWHLANIELTQDRNYRAFSVLAGVRNGYGFGGSSTGEEVTPISEPRGLPEDMSPELRFKLEQEIGDEVDVVHAIWLGEYGFSWLTLKELMDYDLDAPLLMRGFVPGEAAQRYRETGEIPSFWAGWTPLPGFERLEWQEPIRQAAWLVPKLIEELSALGDPQNVRMVFGFDN